MAPVFSENTVTSSCPVLALLSFFSLFSHIFPNSSDEPASVAQLDTPSDWRPGGRGFNPR